MAATHQVIPSTPRQVQAFRLYVALLALASAAVVPSALAGVRERPFAALVWVILPSVASFMSIQTLPGLKVETTLRGPLSIASAVILEPPVALFCNALVLWGGREFRRDTPRRMLLFNHLQTGLSAYVAALAAQSQPFGPIAATVVAVLVFQAANNGAIALGARILGRARLGEAVRRLALPFPSFAVNYLFVALLAVLIVVLYTEVSPWALGLLAVPMWLGYTALRSSWTANERADELALRVRELEVVHDLGPALLAAQERTYVLGLGEQALREICDARPDDVVVALDGRVPEGLRRRALLGSGAAVGLPADLDDRRAAQAETVCNTIELALQRLAVEEQRLAVEEQLQASQRAQAQLAEGILIEGAVARSRVALNVHDDVLPYLAAAQIQSENVVTAAEMGDVALTTKLANQVRDAVADGIRTLREVLEDLRRQTIVPGNLVPFVQRAARDAQLEQGLEVDIDTEAFDGDVSHPVEILLTETITGLLTNVVRHARATNVSIRLASNGDTVLAEVVDDGVGFDPASVGSGHQGLALMRHRAMVANGRFSVDSRPGCGTVVRLEVPPGPKALTPAARR
jgi:signal transduction histidine kinase